MAIAYAEQKIKEARSRVAALDRELAGLRRQSRKVAKISTRAVRCWRCASRPHAWRRSAAGRIGKQLAGGGRRTLGLHPSRCPYCDQPLPQDTRSEQI